MAQYDGSLGYDYDDTFYYGAGDDGGEGGGSVSDPSTYDLDYGTGVPEDPATYDADYGVSGIPIQDYSYSGFSAYQPYSASSATSKKTTGSPTQAKATASTQANATATNKVQVPISSTTTQSFVMPDTPAPVLGDLPSYNAPEWDKNEVRNIARRIAAPRISEMRRMVRLALTKSYRNPNLRHQALREALAGYGLGISQISAGASTQAAQEYGQQFAVQANKAGAEYQAAVNAHLTAYRSAWDNYLKLLETSTTQTTTMGMLDTETGVIRTNTVV